MANSDTKVCEATPYAGSKNLLYCSTCNKSFNIAGTCELGFPKVAGNIIVNGKEFTPDRRPALCEAVQLSDQMKCVRCGVSWDVNDGAPPACRTIEEAVIGRSPFKEGKYQSEPPDPKPEAVNHPQHYGGDTVYEVVKVAEAWGWDKDTYLFQMLRYTARAGKKDPAKLIEDYEKAAWYLARKIANMKKELGQ